MAWTLPCAGWVTSPFGPRILAAGMFPFHYGVDVHAGRGPIFAAQAGVVRSIWITTKGGWVVDIRHADEGGRQIRTRYIHMYRDEIRVSAGQQVKAGDWIGNSGESGSPGSPHLHFEVMVNGALVNPVPFLAARGLTFGVSLVSNVIGGVGVPPGAPTGTLPDPLTPEDDMPLNAADLDAIQKRVNAALVSDIIRGAEFKAAVRAQASAAVTALIPTIAAALDATIDDEALLALLREQQARNTTILVPALTAAVIAALPPAGPGGADPAAIQAAAEAAIRRVLGSLD